MFYQKYYCLYINKLNTVYQGEQELDEMCSYVITYKSSRLDLINCE